MYDEFILEDYAIHYNIFKYTWTLHSNSINNINHIITIFNTILKHCFGA